MSKPIQPSLNFDVARNLGSLLRSRRESVKLTPQDVADKLLFSKAQVLGLETGETHFFYGARLFAQCADKYAAFLGLTELPSVTLLTTENPAVVIDPTGAATNETEIKKPVVQDEALAVPVDADGSAIAIHSNRRSIWPFITIVVSALGLFVIATILWQKPESKISEPVVAAKPVESTPPATTAQNPAPTIDPPQPTTVNKEQIPSGSIQLSFSGSSWVQVVESNGTRQEKTYKAGDTLILEPKNLQALVIGNAKMVRMTSDQGDVGIIRHIAPGSQVARIVGDNIRLLGH